MAIRLIENLVLKGNETVEGIKYKREFGKTREAWIAAVFLLGKIRKEKKIWYLRGNEIENSSDDIYARSIWKENGVVHSGPVLPIQIVRKTKHNKESAVSLIKKKLKGDLKGVSLVCYVMTTEIIDWENISIELAKLKPKTEGIALIGNMGGGKFIVGTVHPNVQTVEVDLGSTRINAPDIIEATEVNKPEKTGITKQGTALLTPFLKIKDTKPR